MTPIQRVAELGQSIWLDNLRRSMFGSGELARMIGDGLRGMTSNPTIFDKAIAGGDDYDDAIRALVAREPGLDDVALFERLAVADIQAACDAFRPVYEQSGHGDGFVSLEVSPRVASDTQATIAEARRLHAAVARPNVMIKVPGTAAGMPAIRCLIADGIKVNTTLLFGLDAYLAAADAYLTGLEERVARGDDVRELAGVASFFLSRIDTAVDKQLDALAASATGERRALLAGLRGKTAIANAKAAYVKYQELIGSPRWQALAAAGARPQRLLWASTSTKDPAYPPLMYVEALIGRDTVDTVPSDTYRALLDHGAERLRESLPDDLDGAGRTLARLAEVGVSLDAVTDQLVVDGVALFAASFDGVVRAVASKRARLGRPSPGRAAPVGAPPGVPR
ncbi:MAG TPA: transaldolase [Kofleriaceae bacterium]|nr:transaldolase [Kofleriaceae bacterium]